jgi:hypothetical protein
MYDLETSPPCAPSHRRGTNTWLKCKEPIRWFVVPPRLGRDFIDHTTPERKSVRRGYRQEGTISSIGTRDTGVASGVQSIFTEQTLKQRFQEHAEKWAYETAHLSSPAQMMMHPSYQAILGLAHDNKEEVVHLMLTDLQEHRRPWFWALSYLTGDNPIKSSDAGKLEKMIKSWIEWGQKRTIL